MRPAPIQIETEQWKIVQEVMHKYLTGYRVWAFGSRAKGCAGKFSDLDILIEACPDSSNLPPLTLAKIRTEFSESLLPWPVDVIDGATCEPSFLSRIAKDRVQIWP